MIFVDTGIAPAAPTEPAATAATAGDVEAAAAVPRRVPGLVWDGTGFDGRPASC